jgi:GNAT superfamily N-acetyltransferase
VTAGTIEVRRAAPADHAAILPLLAAALGWRADEDLAGFFEWKHRANPFGESPSWVAVADNRVVGFRTFLRWEFQDTSGATLRAVRAVDTATLPEYQGRGVFRALTLAAIDDLKGVGVDFVFNTPNDKSRPGYLSMGWHAIGRLPVAARMRGPRGAVRTLRSRVPAGRWPLITSAGVPASDILDDPRVPDLLDTIARRGLRTRRTAAHLRWRYGYAPLGYRAITAGAIERGVAVFRVRARGRAREAAICEVLVPDGDRATASKLVREVGRATGADYVIRLGPPALTTGFLPMPGQGPILTWRAVTTNDPPPPLDRWQLSLGDVELL